MMTSNSDASHNCRSEITFAKDCGKKMMPVMLEDFSMSMGLRMQLSSVHFLKRFEIGSDEALLKQICEVEAVKACRDPEGTPLRLRTAENTKTDAFGNAYSGTEEYLLAAEYLMLQDVINGRTEVMTFTSETETLAAPLTGRIRQTDVNNARTAALYKMQRLRERLLGEKVYDSAKVKFRGEIYDPAYAEISLCIRSHNTGIEDAMKDLMADILYLKDCPSRAASHDLQLAQLQKKLAEYTGQQDHALAEIARKLSGEEAACKKAEEALKQAVTDSDKKIPSLEEQIQKLQTQIRSLQEAVRQAEFACSQKQSALETAKEQARADSDAVRLQYGPMIRSVQEQIIWTQTHEVPKMVPAFLLDAGTGVTHLLDRETTVIGSDPDSCDVVIHDHAAGNNRAIVTISDANVSLQHPGTGHRVRLEETAIFRLGNSNLILLGGSAAKALDNGESVHLLINKTGSGLKLITKDGIPLNRYNPWADGTLLNDRGVHRESHAFVRMQQGQILLEDDSRAGTYLNGSRLQQKERCTLSPGDTIRVGKTELQYLVACQTDNGNKTIYSNTEYRR